MKNKRFLILFLILSFVLFSAIGCSNVVVEEKISDKSEIIDKVTEEKEEGKKETKGETSKEDSSDSNEELPPIIEKEDKDITIEDLVKAEILFEVKKDGKLKGWKSKGDVFYGFGSKEGTRIEHVFQHLIPRPDKPKHSMFDTNKVGLINLIDEAFENKDAGKSKLQNNGYRVYDVEMNRVIGTEGETIIRLVVRDKSNSIITAYPRK